MRTFEKLQKRAHNLKQELTALCYAYQHPDLKPLPKLIFLFALGYALSPIDLIPDFIPVIGYLDDLIIIPALIGLSIKLIPEGIMIQSRKKAIQHPIKLKKNWLFAVFIITIWAILLAIIIA